MARCELCGGTGTVLLPWGGVGPCPACGAAARHRSSRRCCVCGKEAYWLSGHKYYCSKHAPDDAYATYW